MSDDPATATVLATDESTPVDKEPDSRATISQLQAALKSLQETTARQEEANQRQMQEQQEANQRQIQALREARIQEQEAHQRQMQALHQELEETMARKQINEQEVDGFRQIREQQVRQELRAEVEKEKRERRAEVEKEKRERRAEVEMVQRRFDADAAARNERKFVFFFSSLWSLLMSDAKKRKGRAISDGAGRSSRGGEGSSQNESARAKATKLREPLALDVRVFGAGPAPAGAPDSDEAPPTVKSKSSGKGGANSPGVGGVRASAADTATTRSNASADDAAEAKPRAASSGTGTAASPEKVKADRDGCTVLSKLPDVLLTGIYERLTIPHEQAPTAGYMGAHLVPRALLAALRDTDLTANQGDLRAVTLATAKIDKFQSLISDWKIGGDSTGGDEPRKIISRLRGLEKEMDAETPRFCFLPPKVTGLQAPDPAKTVEQLAELRESFYKGWTLTIFDSLPLPIDIATPANTHARTLSVVVQVPKDIVEKCGGARPPDGKFKDAEAKAVFKLEGATCGLQDKEYLVDFDPEKVSLRALFLACTYQLHRATGALNKYSAHLVAFANSLKAYRERDKLVGERVKLLPKEDSHEKVRKWRREVVHPF
jgi:hypothetical protein